MGLGGMCVCVDIAIIGGGAAGLSAAINAVARGKTVRIFSNKTNYLARAERVDNYLGFYQINGTELMNFFRQHAKQMGIEVEIGKVVNIIPFNKQFMINFNGDIIVAKAVILALGVTKAKTICGEETFIGKGVSYCATCDGMLYRQKDVIVYGYADDIVEEANFLVDIGANVTFISASARPNELKQNISFVHGNIQEIIGQDLVEAVKVKENLIKTNGVFILRNALAPSALIEELEIVDGFIKVDRKMNTNIAGIFACGDCVGTPLQVAKAVGEGLIAAQEAAKYIEKSGGEKIK